MELVKWLSELHRRECKVWKNTIFGKSVRSGWELTSPLTCKVDETILHLPVGYVWDGASYGGFFQKILGNRKWECLLAASAIHDAMGVRILTLTEQGNVHRSYSIKSSAKIYRNLIEAWEGESTDRMAAIQYWGLRIFHPIVNLIEKRELWKKAD